MINIVIQEFSPEINITATPSYTLWIILQIGYDLRIWRKTDFCKENKKGGRITPAACKEILLKRQYDAEFCSGIRRTDDLDIAIILPQIYLAIENNQIANIW